MIYSVNSYDNLKTVIVGDELNLTKRVSDITFKYFYKENLGQMIYENNTKDYIINYDLLQERIEDLNNLAKVLEKESIKVLRPNQINTVKKIETPTFKTELSSASNVRDLTLIYQDKIIETPTFVRNRYFENINLYEVLYKEWKNTKYKSQWIKAPFNKLTEESIDLNDYFEPRDFSKTPDNFDMAIDAAQYIRINANECFVNISTYNHYLGHLWVESLFPDVTFYRLYQLIDNHLDGVFNILKEGVFLVNPKYNKTILKKYLPKKFHSWLFIYPKETSRAYPKTNTTLNNNLASENGMDINVLSISEDTVVVSEDAVNTIKVLEKNKFKVIPVRFRHSEIFAGGIHCSTLDIYRK